MVSQPNRQAIDAMKVTTAATHLVIPAASWSLENLLEPVHTAHILIISRTIPTAAPAISLYRSFHTTTVIAVLPKSVSDTRTTDSSTALRVSFTAVPISLPK